jgi:hypothetical protein
MSHPENANDQPPPKPAGASGDIEMAVSNSERILAQY